MADGVAHDFNNFLSVILGNPELLQADAALKRPQRDLVDEIHKAGERGKALTQQLLGMSRVSQGRILVTLEQLRDARAVSRESAAFLPPVDGDGLSPRGARGPDFLLEPF